MEQKKENFKVVFSCKVIVEGLTLEQALQFALNLHQSSNVSHLVSVVDYSAEQEVTILTLVKNAA